MTSGNTKQASRLKREEACGFNHKTACHYFHPPSNQRLGEIYLAGDCLGFQIFSLCRLRRSLWTPETAAHYVAGMDQDRIFNRLTAILNLDLVFA